MREIIALISLTFGARNHFDCFKSGIILRGERRMNDKIASLIRLSHEIGREDRQLDILAEGNASAKISETEFAVKASGCRLAALTEAEIVTCQTSRILSILDQKNLSDVTIDDLLLESRTDPTAKKPSVEAMFHAWLLNLDGINFVGHCHPVTVNQVLCSPRARDFAERRLFPDEVVVCGEASVFVPYVDPGLALAREIAERTRAFHQQRGSLPRLILLQNHGIIAIGANPESVLACILMAEKAAAIFSGAAAMGGPNFMPPQHVERIAARPDEAYRQKELRI